MTRITRCFVILFIVLSPVACQSQSNIDMLVYGVHVITMDAAMTVIENGAVAIDDGVILAVGTAEDINADYTAAQTLAGDNRIVMPGLVNGHSHAAMTLLRGVADDLALMDWLNNYIFPAEVDFVDAEFVRIGTGRHVLLPGHDCRDR
ncbi:MAG: amidohydrolase family protein [Woeseiaceae bacterium]